MIILDPVEQVVKGHVLVKHVKVQKCLVVITFLHAHLPLVSVSHDDASALLVVLGNAHLGNILRSLDPQSLINLILLQNT